MTRDTTDRRILLFDWSWTGHHPLYVEKTVEALGPSASLVVAAPCEAAQRLAELGVRHVPLEARPRVDPSRHFDAHVRAARKHELALFRAAIADVAPDHAFHLFGDGLLPSLVRSSPIRTRTTLLLFRPRAHYPRLYGTALTARERLKARVHEHLVQRWRHHPDAHAVLTLDEQAALLWMQHPGAAAHWFPEPPVAFVPCEVPWEERDGALLYGVLSPRKGIRLVADAVLTSPDPVRLRLAGPIDVSSRPHIVQQVADMQAGGAQVEVLEGLHNEEQGLNLLAQARCALLPYVQHWGMSRVLLEAAAARTPVVASKQGLIGDLVQRHGLGLAIDVSDRRAFAESLTAITRDPDQAGRYTSNLEAFAAQYSRASFEQRLRAVFEESGD